MTYEIIADFDGTLTRKGEGCDSSFDVLRDALPEQTRKISEEIYQQYTPLEFDFSLSLEKRNEYMEEWWNKEFEITIAGGLTLDMIHSAGNSERLVFRENVRELFLFAYEQQIPLLVFTAGIANIIDIKLEKEGLSFPNVQVVGNRFLFDTEGKAVTYTKPVVYVGNKHLIAQSFVDKIHHDIVFLLGDHPTDADMCHDDNHTKVIRFGFLNEKNNDNGSYSRYDYLYKEKDSSVEEVLMLIREEKEENK